MPRESVLISTMVELADNLVDHFDVIDVLTMLSDRAVEVVEVDAAGVMLASPDGELQFVAASSESMTVLELFQLQADEGPCIDCYRSGQAIANEALSEPDDHWPRFTPLAISKGFTSVHCLPMRLRGRTIGALNLFRRLPGRLSSEDVVAAQGLADVATIAILQHRTVLDAQTLNGQLSSALNSRIIIEQAKGRISQATRCDMDQAFDKLRSYARNHNLRLTDVATSVVDGALVADVLTQRPPVRR